MQPVPYLFFRDTCAEAMRFYARTFGSDEPRIMTFADAPAKEREQMPDAPADAVMHAAVKVGDGWLYGSDDPSGDTPAMAGTSIAVTLPALDEAQRVFDALAEGGEIRMPFQPTFWSPGFGALTDRYGTRWMVMADSPEGGS